MLVPSVCQNSICSLRRHLASRQCCRTARESEPDSGEVEDEAGVPFRSLLVGSRHRQEEDGVAFCILAWLFILSACVYAIIQNVPSTQHLWMMELPACLLFACVVMESGGLAEIPIPICPPAHDASRFRTHSEKAAQSHSTPMLICGMPTVVPQQSWAYLSPPINASFRAIPTFTTSKQRCI